MPEKSGEKDFGMIIEIPQETLAYLNRLSTEAKATGGKDIELAEFIRATLTAFLLEKKNVDLTGITNEKELIARILESSMKRPDIS